MPKKILITGSKGFIAKNIKDLFAKKYDLELISRSSKYRILNLKSLFKIDDVDTVIHCAAKTFIPDSFTNQYSFYRFNILSSMNIAEFCKTKNVKKLIFLNAYPYGKPSILPIDENQTLQPHSPYNASKLLSEDLLFKYLEGKTDVVSLRVFNIYGKHQTKNFLIPTMIKQAKSVGKITLNDLRPKRDFLYIKDLVNLIDKIIVKKSITGIYNVGYGKSFSIYEISETISNLLNINIELKTKNIFRKNEVLDLYADIGKVKNSFNWTPKYSIREGLKDYLQNE